MSYNPLQFGLRPAAGFADHRNHSQKGNGVYRGRDSGIWAASSLGFRPCLFRGHTSQDRFWPSPNCSKVDISAKAFCKSPISYVAGFCFSWWRLSLSRSVRAVSANTYFVPGNVQRKSLLKKAVDWSSGPGPRALSHSITNSVADGCLFLRIRVAPIAEQSGRV
jgi:hypothetical protein